MLTVQAHNPEQEEAEEEIEVAYEGDDLEVGFNVNYLLDALAAIDGAGSRTGPDRQQQQLPDPLARQRGGALRRHAHEAVSRWRCARMQVTDFRCLQSAELELDPRFTLISGPNASGKTSLLEAIYVLGRGRSFRTRRLEHLIRRGSRPLRGFWRGRVRRDRTVRMGVEGDRRPECAPKSAARSRPRWRNLPPLCRFKSSIRKFTSSSRRVPAGGAASWIGACSTWNRISWRNT